MCRNVELVVLNGADHGIAGADKKSWTVVS